MAGAKGPRGNKPNPELRFFDDEERELIENFEGALERGEVRWNMAEELTEAKAQWTKIAAAKETGDSHS
jgi:hypothetical protein